MNRYEKTKQMLQVFIVNEALIRDMKFTLREEKYHTYVVEKICSSGNPFPYFTIEFGSTQVRFRVSHNYCGSKTIPRNKKYGHKIVGEYFSNYFDDDLYAFDSFEKFEEVFKKYIL